ncbi:MAG: ABC transporter substrate-binding protein [Thermoleophilia bacterium]
MPKVRLFLPFVLLILALSIVVGCGGGGDATTTTTAAPTSDTTVGETAPPAGEPIILGVPTALGTVEGKDALRVTEMAVEEINAAGGVDVGGTMRPFKVESIDTREAEPGVPTNDALAAIEKLISEKKPDIITVGAFRSEVLLGSMDLVAKYKIPYVTTIAMSPDYEKKIGENKELYGNFFRTGQNAPGFVGGLSAIMATIKSQSSAKVMYVIHQDVLWAKGSAAGIAKGAEADGWTVAGIDAYPTGASDFSSSLNKAQAAGTQVLVAVFDMPQAGVLLKQSKSMKIDALLAGFVGPFLPASAWDANNGDVDGFVGMLHEPASMPIEALPKTVEFYNAFTAKFGEKDAANIAGHGVGPAYDTVYLLKAAIEKAGSLDAAAVSAALETTELDGVIGHLKFNENHQVIYGPDPATQAISIGFQWVNGERVPIYPPAIAQQQVTMPQ